MNLLNKSKNFLSYFLIFVSCQLVACAPAIEQASVNQTDRKPLFPLEKKTAFIEELILAPELQDDRMLANRITDSFINSLKREQQKDRFSWCNCGKLSDWSRMILAAKIVAQMKTISANKRQNNNRNILVSLGSGKLLLEYLIVEAFDYLGMTNIEIILIDKSYEDPQQYARAMEFKEMFSSSSLNRHVSVLAYMGEYKTLIATGRKNKADIFFAVDVPEVSEESFNNLAANVLDQSSHKQKAYYLLQD